jgi:E3 ubiquitin-protein ligase SspH2
MEIAKQRVNEWTQTGDTSIILDLSELELTSLPALPNNLLKLNCSRNNLTSLLTRGNVSCCFRLFNRTQQLPNTLIYLNCENNLLTSLPSLPNNLQKIFCCNNKLSNIPDLPDNLQLLDCGYNKITKLPTLPNTLQTLDCGHNKIKNLPTLPNSLQKLYCRNNKLTSLLNTSDSRYKNLYENSPRGHEPWSSLFQKVLYKLINLHIIDCRNNELTSLLDLPINLETLRCSDNKLCSLSLSELTNLQELNCWGNKLQNLWFPSNLQIINCGENELTNLPDLPYNLQQLYCNNNKLTSLPDLSHLVNLRYLYFRNSKEWNLSSSQIKFIIDNKIQTDYNIEETPQELQIRINNANERMKQITQQNIRNSQIFLSKDPSENDSSGDDNNENENSEDMSGDDPSELLNLDIIDSNEQLFLKSNCKNSNDLIGNKLSFKYGNITIVDSNKSELINMYCFTYPEAIKTFRYDRTFMPHPYIGIIIDQRGLLLTRLYNTFVLVKSTNDKTLQVPNNIYTLEPISFSTIYNKEPITNETIKNFIPTFRDLNLYYLSNTQIIKIGVNGYKIVGVNGSIEINKNNKINIIKIKEINKTYKIQDFQITCI